MASNLTKASFLIHIEDPGRLLSNIFWESCSEIGMTSEVVQTSNGRRRYMMGTRPTPKPITLSKAANTDEDAVLDQWLQTFCQQDGEIINGLEGAGPMLILTPLKPCLVNEPYPQKIKVYNLLPTDWSLWDSDVMSTTDTSRSTIVCQWTRYTLG